MIRPLSGGEDVGMVRDQREAAAPVLKGEGAPAGDEARAEAGEGGVDEGAAVAVLVGYGEVDGVGVLDGEAVGEGVG